MFSLDEKPVPSFTLCRTDLACKSTMIRDCCRVACAVQHADDNNRVRKRTIINRIGAMESDAQSGGKLLSRRSGEWKIPDRLKGRFNRGDKARRDFLGCVACDSEPDFGEVLLGGLGKAKG